MEATPQPLTNSQTTAAPAPPIQITLILQSIDQLVNAVLSSNGTVSQGLSSSLGSGTENYDASFRPVHQANALKTFRDWMIEVQRKASKAMHEVETKLGPEVQALGQSHRHSIATDAPLQDLPGVDPNTELNRALGRTELNGKQSFKLRDIVTSRLPSSIIMSPQVVVADDGAAVLPPSHYGTSSGEDKSHMVVLQPTLRNVWVLQHAYAKLLNYKEGLIMQYFASAIEPTSGPPMSRKFAREYYEVPSLANLPSKDKLGNLLDVRSSTYHSNATGDIMLVLVMPPDGNGDGSPTFVEAVTGDTIIVDQDVNVDVDVDVDNTHGDKSGSAHLILPVTEASIRMLYDAYRALRGATSAQRRASKDRAFAATLPVDEVDELEKQFNFGGASASASACACASVNGVGGSGPGSGPGENTMGRKRRRMLEDEDGRD
ncbi:hypothetical protein SLS62_008799 [Diatrype stigma]|uniref:Uncharacterized protein n=1 Tax=Diatrype stigma TaxID=117547 RepID=A0AAN9YMP6_9PEZI